MAQRIYNKQDGTMTFNGQVYRVKKLKETDSSNGITKHITTLWTDNSLSCTCQGWCIQKAGKERTCKHCKESIACNFSDMQTPLQMVRANSGYVMVSKPKDDEEGRMIEL